MEAIPSGIVPIANLPGTDSLIGRSFGIYKAQFQKIIQLTGMMALGYLVNVSLSSFIGFLSQNAPALGKAFLELLSIGITVGVSFFYCFIFSTFVHLVAAWYRNGEQLSLQEAFIRAGKVYKSLFLVGLLYAFAIAGTSFFIIIPVIFSQGQFPVDMPSYRALLMLYTTAFQWGTAIAIILPLLFSLWYYFSIYAVIIDGDRGIGALAKSRYLMHGMFFKVAGRYATALLLLTLTFFLVYLATALPFGWLVSPLFFIVFIFLALPFFAVYEYLRYEDLHTVERTTEFVLIKGERKSILTWSVLGGIVMVVNILAGFYVLLPAQAREDFEVSLTKGAVYVFAPATIEMDKNTRILTNFFAKFRSEENVKKPETLFPDEGGVYIPSSAPKNYSDYNPSAAPVDGSLPSGGQQTY